MMIQATELWKRFGNCDALKGLNLAVPEGSAFALIGANGAGKTTVIKNLMNIMEPSRGSVSVLGVDSRNISPRELARIGYVSENQDMPARLTVIQFLNYLRPFYPTWDSELEQELLRRLRLPLDRKIRDLSHGMRIKLALACALPFRPKLLVLDEPFSGLDPLVRDEFMEGLLQQAGDMTVFISSHELSEIEGVATHIGFLDQGRLVFQESMSDLTGRVREVRVTLERPATIPGQVPREWLQVCATGNVVGFVDIQFSDENLQERVASSFRGVRSIDVQPIALRSIFTALSRAAQNGGLEP